MQPRPLDNGVGGCGMQGKLLLESKKPSGEILQFSFLQAEWDDADELVVGCSLGGDLIDDRLIRTAAVP